MARRPHGRTVDDQQPGDPNLYLTYFRSRLDVSRLVFGFHRKEWWTFVGVAIITGMAAGVRIAGLQQSLFGDELFTYFHVAHRSLGGVFSTVLKHELSPPLYFLFGWFTSWAGDPTVTLRLASVILGTATVPLLFAVGRRVAGDRAGLIAATLLALSPFAVFYSTEARPYMTMVFFTVLATFALVCGLDTHKLVWWVAWAIAAVAALYSHYVAVFFLTALACWAMVTQGECRRQLVVANAAIVTAFAVWVPGLIAQSQNHQTKLLAALTKLTATSAWQQPVRVFAGHPFSSLDRVPGGIGLVLGAAGVALAGLGAFRMGAGKTDPRASPATLRAWVLAALVFAPIVGALLWRAFSGEGFYTARVFITSLPVACLLFGVTAAAARRAWMAAAAAALVAASFAIGTVSTLTRYPRPALRDAAHYINRHISSDDAVVQESPLGFPGPLQHDLDIYLRRGLTVVHVPPIDQGRPPPAAPLRVETWRALDRYRRLFLVAPIIKGHVRMPSPRAAYRQLLGREDFDGLIRYAVLEYGPRRAQGAQP